MDMLAMSIPQISISLAPPEDIPQEPYSPFANAVVLQQDDDAFRPVHLTPPPTHTKFIRPLAPRCASPTDEPTRPTGKGLDRARFEALLSASKEKPSVVKRSTDLRKEVALKAHKHKQVERRALFLSKVLAPPSPTAATMPVTPPDSPAVFHYSLPSPGLISPIAHYESLHEDEKNDIFHVSCKPWVEQVDFKLLSQPKDTRVRGREPSVKLSRRTLPSLEQISARLNNYRSARAFNDSVEVPVMQSAPVTQNHLVIGRLRMPVRNSTNAQTPSITVTAHDVPVPVHVQAPKSPLMTSPSELKITTLVVPRTQSHSPTELNRVNLLALNNRETRSSKMLNTLRRRTQSNVIYDLPAQCQSPDDIEKKVSRRHSAPPDTTSFRARKGFEHPVLALPGGF